jgi:integrase
MSRPWKKKPWPRVGKKGKKSYVVGYYDHEHRERSKSFSCAGGVGGADEWMRDYRAAERRGPESLRRFLLDLDAREANGTRDGRTLGEVAELYFALDADPDLEGGLAPATFDSYKRNARIYVLGGERQNCRREVIGRHPFAVRLAALPVVLFNEPDEPRRWREEMRGAGLTKSRRYESWKVLSAILSWAASSHLIPEVSTNGCLLAGERTRSRRRSSRSGATGRGQTGRRGNCQIPAWALSPQAVEAIREQMLLRVAGRDPILALRDATVVSTQYGLAARNQEVWGLRWERLDEEFAEILQVISWGELDEYGKTNKTTERRASMPPLLWADLKRWRSALRAWGHPARDVDFVFPGDLGGKTRGKLDEKTGAVHLTKNQCQKWCGKFFTPAVRKVAERDEFWAILGATPYSLRRGGISVRLRAEDAQIVAEECGTSLEMLDRHYAFAMHDLRRYGPAPFNEVWSAARNAPTTTPVPPAPAEPQKRPRLRLVA